MLVSTFCLSASMDCFFFRRLPDTFLSPRKSLLLALRRKLNELARDSERTGLGVDGEDMVKMREVAGRAWTDAVAV